MREEREMICKLGGSFFASVFSELRGKSRLDALTGNRILSADGGKTVGVMSAIAGDFDRDGSLTISRLERSRCGGRRFACG